MRNLLGAWAILLSCGAPLLRGQGQMAPYLEVQFSNSSQTSSDFTINGSASYGNANGLQITSSSGASLISKTAVPDGTSQYEVSTLGYVGSGALVLYLEATSNALLNPAGASTGSFYAFVLTQTGSNCSTEQATLYKAINGSVTQIASTTFPCTDIAGYSAIAANDGSFRLQVPTSGSSFSEPIIWTDSSPLKGQPGLGAYGMPSNAYISSASLTECDRVPPSAIDASTIKTYVQSTEVDIRTAGSVDNSGGVGFYEYQWYRDGKYVTATSQPEYQDLSVAAGSTHTYGILASDFDGNNSSQTTFTVTTPANSDIDPLQIGVRPTGSYWGGKGEQLDLRSGNLNYQFPLLKVTSRGWSVPLGLSYNSQNWRLDSDNNAWNLGFDAGYGYGWNLVLGSITPYYSSMYTVAFYQYTDASGAIYRLDQNSSGIWTSKQSIYVSFDANAQRLHFNDGTQWYFGCMSGGLEADAGSIYPTLLQDSNGNQILIQYESGKDDLTYFNGSSRRISKITDVRPGSSGGSTAPTYVFAYDGSNYLSSITSNIGTGEAYSFTYSSAFTLTSPFSYSAPAETVKTLSSVTNTATNLTTSFSYASSNDGELTQVTMPLGGHIRWQYSNLAYSQATVRAVTERFLQWNSSIGERTYTFSMAPDSTKSMTFSMLLTDLQSAATEIWSFNTSSGPTQGLIGEIQRGPSGKTPLRQFNYNWAADSVGNEYISRVQEIFDPFTSGSVTKQIDQTVDQYGNATQTKLYDFSDLTNPAKTYNRTYLSSSGGTNYTALYIRNRLSTVTVTDKSGTTTTLKQNTYDQYPNGITPTTNITNQDTTNYGTSYTTRGNVYDEALPWASYHHNYDQTGTPLWTGNDVNPNHYVSALTSSTTNYAAPDTVTTGNSFNTNLTWSPFIGITSNTGWNSEQSTTQYDNAGRPSTSTSKYGAKTTYSYSISAPQMTATTNGHWIQTSFDGLGRVAQIAKGYGSTTVSIMQYTYDAVGASPLGSITKRSTPYASGGTPVWSTSTYDALGRITTQTRPDGASKTTFSYAGASTTETDPAGHWKTFTLDAYNQLVQVLEPTPNASKEPNHVSTYTYDTFGHLTQAQMSRTISGTVVTQTRSWVYNPKTLLLTSKTTPESGTVTFTYNSDGTLATATDAKNQRRVYTYDSYGRITQIARGTVSNGTFTENTSQRTTYQYEGTNGGYSSATAGRVSQITYSGPHGLSFVEWYNYMKAGAVTNKRLTMTGTPFGSSSINMDAVYTYDSEGNITSIQYPNAQFNSNNTTTAGPKYTYGYDSMERRSSMVDQASTHWVSGVSYTPAGQIAQLTANTFTETRTYNANLELIELVSGSNVHYKYNYSSTQDNAQVLSVNDVISGETISYQYDTLERLIQASGTGDPSGAWSQSFTYDGFGNLSQIAASNAPALSLAVNSQTNQITTSSSYDANGNLTSYSGSTYGYDIDNRLTQANPSSGGEVLYGYDTTNHRVYKGAYSSGTYSAEEIYFYGAEGHKYGAWKVNPSSGVLLQASVTKQWFGSRLLSPQDRLDSRGKYFPFGQERTNITPPNPPNDQEKYQSYTRDSFTGLDYANERYYNNLIGRFMQTDRMDQSANAAVPQSWNRYGYAADDPANHNDPSGLDLMDAMSAEDGGGGGGGGFDGGGFGGFGFSSTTPDFGSSTGAVSFGQPANGADLGEIPDVSGFYDTNGNFVINDPNVNPTTIVNVTASAPTVASTIGSSIAQGAYEGTIGPLVNLGQALYNGPQNWVNGFGNLALNNNPAGALQMGLAEAPAVGLVTGGLALAGSSVTSIAPVQQGTTVYRVFDNINAFQYGSYWTTVDPATVPNYTQAAGLFNNQATLVEQGVIQTTTGYNFGFSAAGPGGVGGGLPEVYIFSPSSTVGNVTVGPFNP
jgi:RHS repeat-associated protein